MRIYNRYLLVLVTTFTFSTTLLAAHGQDKLDAYFTVYVIEYLVVTLLFVYLDSRTRRLLDGLGYVLFGGFLAIVLFKVLEILRRS
jgi:hypothetical protein